MFNQGSQNTPKVTFFIVVGVIGVFGVFGVDEKSGPNDILHVLAIVFAINTLHERNKLV